MAPPSDKLDCPVLEFVCLERYNAVRLVQLVHVSLAELNKVIRGNTLLSSQVQKMASSLLKNEVWEGQGGREGEGGAGRREGEGGGGKEREGEGGGGRGREGQGGAERWRKG